MKVLTQTVLSFLFLALAWGLQGQDSPLKALSLDDMSNFRTTGSNWQIVGEVQMDRSGGMSSSPGKGILLNNVGPKDHDLIEGYAKAQQWDKMNAYRLMTGFEHGDIELELEFMLPKGSNSGIYLQGRYEVQLFDSWGTKSAKYSDLGGIYRNWETEPAKIYMGKAPQANAAKAPGLWQKMYISFQAPRFDAQGKKVENARFNKVLINGVLVHENIEVPLPTGGPLENNETAMGPIFIQGDHGAVAFRNIRYRSLGAGTATVGDLVYRYFEGKYKVVSDFATTTPKIGGNTKDITSELLEREDSYGLAFNGNVTVPADADYTFTTLFTGGVKLEVNGKTVVENQTPDGWWGNRNGTINLKAGTHPFVFYYYKDAPWMPPRLALYAEGPAIKRTMLTTYSSYPPNPNPEPQIYVNVQNKPRLLRAFLDFDGDNQRRLTHTIGVGEPSGVHYVYDLKAGNLACVWRGNFIDAYPMWNDRGDGSFRPRGLTQFLFMGQTFGVLKGGQGAFPTVYDEKDFDSKGYRMNNVTDRPIFRYTYQGMEVEDRVQPSEDQQSILREINVGGNIPVGAHAKFAEGKSIRQLAEGGFSIDDKYYILPERGAGPMMIRTQGDKQELIAPVAAGVIRYSIVW